MISKNIPIPAIPKTKYPFKDMKVGDSFLLDSNMKRTVVSIKCCQFAKKSNTGIKFTVRKLKNGDIRCWRVK